MRILVTGATGYIGSAFVRLALKHGHQVAALVRQQAVALQVSNSSNLLVLEGTLAEPPWKRIGEFKPEVCVHAAWITTPGIYLESPENYRWLKESLEFFSRLTEFGVNHWFSLGTCIEYQISPERLSEARTPIAPATTYARCKTGVERRSGTPRDDGLLGTRFLSVWPWGTPRAALQLNYCKN
jgi:nucleoside-diphosphate-sugar epimerase